MYNLLRKIQRALGIFAFIFFVIPVSTDYKLINFGFGGGGTSNSTSPNYGLQGIIGELNSIKLSGTSYKFGPGLIFSEQSHVPAAPTFENTGSWYNKLHVVINTSNNPSDTKFALAISTDNFVSDTRYVQSDDTVGTTLGLEDYQTYTGWGGAGGEFVIGLLPNTTYYIKAKAMQGKFTETDFGPVSFASTVSLSFDFDIDVSATDTKTDPPFTITFSDLVAGTVVDSPKKVWVDFATNAESGGYVYVYGQNSGLHSATRSSTIASVTADDLSSLSQGVGAQSASSTHLTPLAPYNGTGQSVGIINSVIQPIYSSTTPVVGGRASFVIKAKSSSITPVADDYTETLTVIASANF